MNAFDTFVWFDFDLTLWTIDKQRNTMFMWQSWFILDQNAYGLMKLNWRQEKLRSKNLIMYANRFTKEPPVWTIGSQRAH